ncbi:MAG: hypothetical protein Q8N08_04295 [Methanobacteriaceae archaeon]|nr:hypothetical protein [Methanobacteriaceae archaeon]
MNPKHIPDEFLVEYGPILHLGEGFNIKLKEETLFYRPGTYHIHEEQIRPTDSHWKDFWREVEDLGLWDWDREYQLCCWDGTGWKVKISYNEREIESMGQNHYPDTFLEFMESLEDLISRELKLDI